jgi:hypothetical protein
MTRDEWCVQFLNYLVLRTDGEVPLRLARTIAANEWPTHSAVDPRVAAKAWFARRAGLAQWGTGQEASTMKSPPKRALC